MPILTPSYLPHPPGLSSASRFCASSKATCLDAPGSQVPTPPTSPEQDAVTQRSDAPPKRERALKIPSVKLEVPSIQENMAATLAIALLGHVLFLKSQVPFPVAQLGRVPGGTSASRAARKRSDMITAFDELSSHLHTTFSALSTALAQNPTHRSTETVYLALVLGPTIGAPKARVVLALEGLEVKVWGQREGIDGAELSTASSSEGDDDDDDDDDDDYEDGDDDRSSDNGSEAGDDSTRGDINTKGEDDAESDGREAEESPPASEPPFSRSQTPSPEEPSQPLSPPPAGSIKRPLRPSLSPPKSSPSLGPKPTRTYAEEQQTLRAAERLLARTLANAYAEGGGVAAELAPTQTHVLLRAPRGFSHPAWLPRQNVSTTLDNTLQDFLVDSGLGDAASTGGDSGKVRRRGVGRIKTEGVLVTCQNSSGSDNDDSTSQPVAATVPTTSTAEAREEDELIWWAWDGKLIGFAEW